jgi:hypothetical protein
VKLMRACAYALMMLIVPFVALSSYAQPACICHSKNPAMKRMHEVIGFKDCDNCHTKDENLMSGNREKGTNDRERLNARFKQDRFCLPCHDSTGAVKKAGFSGSGGMTISGAFFCPKDRLTFPADTKSCPKCGGELINISEFMQRSRTNPSNEICAKCHPTAQLTVVKSHQVLKADKLSMCLSCHKGHDNCSSCHH